MPTEYKSEMDKTGSDFSKKLICIEYPGIVKNVDKMLHTLGGLENIGVAYGTKNRRVELRFRPDDLYCKPACGERHSTTSVVIRVKIKKQYRDPNEPCCSKEADEPLMVTFETSLVGVVDTVYKFDNICDFQYLPMHPKNSEEQQSHMESIYDRLYPAALPSVDWLSEEEDTVPYFLTPPLFSRFDTVHYYNAQRIKEAAHADPHIIRGMRRRRTGYAIFLNFQDEPTPNKAHPEAMKMLQMKFLEDQHYNTLKKLFDERPVWSKNALMYHTLYSKDQLKFLLPTVAYYFLTGPWRVMWCRYGYDPRLIPESRVYQTFDYRLRTVDGVKNQVRAKRSYSNYLLPYKSSPSSRPKVAIINKHSMFKALSAARANGADKKSEGRDDAYLFRPGMVPPTRQMFYQYCDVLVPEVQALLSKLSAPLRGAVCDPRNGWLPHGFDARCREIVNSLVASEVRKQIRLDQDSAAPFDGPGPSCEDTEPGSYEGPHEISDSDGSSSDSELMVEYDDEDTDGIIDSDLDESLNADVVQVGRMSDASNFKDDD